MSTTAALERMEGLQEISPKGSQAEMSCKSSFLAKAAVLSCTFCLSTYAFFHA